LDKARLEQLRLSTIEEDKSNEQVSSSCFSSSCSSITSTSDQESSSSSVASLNEEIKTTPKKRKCKQVKRKKRSKRSVEEDPHDVDAKYCHACQQRLQPFVCIDTYLKQKKEYEMNIMLQSLQQLSYSHQRSTAAQR